MFFFKDLIEKQRPHTQLYHKEAAHTHVHRHTHPHIYLHTHSCSPRMFTGRWERDLKLCSPAALSLSLSLSLSPPLCIPQSLAPLPGPPLNPVIRRWKFVWASPAASSGATAVILKWLTACLTAALAGDGSRIFELSGWQPPGWSHSSHNTGALSVPRQVKQMSFCLFDWLP